MRALSCILLSGWIIALGVSGCTNSTDPNAITPQSEITMNRLTDESPCGEPMIVDLIAAQTIDVGDVIVSNDEDVLTIQIQATGGWVLNKTKVAIGKSLEDIPQTPSGNPKLGQFKPSSVHRPPVSYFEYQVDCRLEPGTELFLAVYASVVPSIRLGGRKQKAEAWADGLQFPGTRWATYFNYTLQPCGGGAEIIVTVPSDRVCQHDPFPISWEPFSEESVVRIELLREDDTLCTVLADGFMNTGMFPWDALPYCDDELTADAYGVRVTDLDTGAWGQSIQFVIEDCGGGE